MKFLKRVGIAIFIVMFMFSGVLADFSLPGYSRPSQKVRSGVWKKVKNSKGDLIGEGFSFPLKYRNKIFRCSNTKFITFGSGQAKRSYNRTKNSKKQSSFWVDKVKKGKTFGIKGKNLKVWNQGKKEYDFIDVEFRVTGWKKAEGYRRKFSPIVCFSHSPVPRVSMSGISSLTMTQKIYKAGTKTSFRIKSNTTYIDIDNGQGMSITNTKSTRMAKNTRLKMKGKVSSPSVYNPIKKQYPAGDIRNNVGISYDNSSMKIRFFDLNALKGKKSDKQTWKTIWGDGHYTYFSAAGVVTILPPNSKPSIKASREYQGSPTNKKFIHYSGRKTHLVASFYDKDRDNLKTWYKLYKNGKLIKTGKKRSHGYYTERKIAAPTQPGDYLIRWYAQDYKIEKKKVSKEDYYFRIVKPVKIWSDYLHTDAWDHKRNYFNYYHFDKKYRCPISFSNFINSGDEVRKRAQNVFWADEEIQIDASVFGGIGKLVNLDLVLPGGVKKSLAISKGKYGKWHAKFLVPDYLKNKAKQYPQKIYPNYKAQVILKDLDSKGNELEKTITIERNSPDFPIIIDDKVLYSSLHLT